MLLGSQRYSSSIKMVNTPTIKWMGTGFGIKRPVIAASMISRRAVS